MPRAAQDGPQRANVASEGFVAPQLRLEAVIDLAGVVEPDEEAEADDIAVRQRTFGQRGETRPNRPQAQQSRSDGSDIDRVVDEAEPTRTHCAWSVRGILPRPLVCFHRIGLHRWA